MFSAASGNWIRWIVQGVESVTVGGGLGWNVGPAVRGVWDEGVDSVIKV